MVGPVDGRRPVALVVGAGSGLGGAIARSLAQKRFDLILNDREDDGALRALCAEVEQSGGQAKTLAHDIARVDEIAGLIEREEPGGEHLQETRRAQPRSGRRPRAGSRAGRDALHVAVA